MFLPTAAMLALADSWARVVRKYVADPEDRYRPGFSLLAVRVIEGRRAVLASNPSIGVVALTIPPTEELRDQFIITINPEEFTPSRYGPSAILHELIHVCDPAFLPDCQHRAERLKSGDPIEYGTRDYYNLESERNAYCGMWLAKGRTKAEVDLLATLRCRQDYSGLIDQCI